MPLIEDCLGCSAEFWNQRFVVVGGPEKFGALEPIDEFGLGDQCGAHWGTVFPAKHTCQKKWESLRFQIAGMPIDSLHPIS